MRGSVVRKGSRYYAVLDLVPGPDGKRRQKWFSGFTTKREAQGFLISALSDQQRGTFVEPTTKTLAEYLDEWVAAIEATLRPSTWDSYKSVIGSYVIPRLGTVRLSKVTAPRLNAFYAELLREGRADGGSLSARTVRYVHTILRRAFEDAVRWQQLARNPASHANPPKPKASELSVWDETQLRAFLASVVDDRLYSLWVLAATTGMRRGELMGLRWTDIDFSAAKVFIRQTRVSVRYEVATSQPKTKTSNRGIAIDSASMNALRSFRAAQLEERLAFGPGYKETGLVFTREDGEPLHPETVTDMFKRRAAGANLPPIRFHDLRHTYASLALKGGIHPKVVSQRLGHSSIAITLDTYSHVLSGVDEDAADAVSRMIFGT